MKDQRQVSTNTTLPEAISQQVRSVFLTIPRLRHRTGSFSKTLLNDWRTSRYLPFAFLLVLLTTLLVVAYYLNHPEAEPLSDTWSYLFVVDRIQTHGQLVNFWRLPGYPLLIVLVYTLMGQGNLAAVSEVQALLFVLATLELYVLTALVLRRAWIAFLISILVGTNILLLSYVKPIMSEAMALWLTVSLALAVVFFLYTLRARTLWLVTAYTLLLFLTRPEWIYLPVPLFAYLLLVAAWQGVYCSMRCSRWFCSIQSWAATSTSMQRRTTLPG